MAYQGYLLKVGNYTIPTNIIGLDSYTVTLNSQDLDSSRDTDGVLGRNALPTKVIKVDFETKDQMTNKSFGVVMQNIRNQMTDRKEQKVTLTAYVPYLDDYVTDSAYLVDPAFQIYRVDNTTRTIYYRPIRMAFIGYGKKVAT